MWQHLTVQTVDTPGYHKDSSHLCVYDKHPGPQSFHMNTTPYEACHTGIRSTLCELLIKIKLNASVCFRNSMMTTGIKSIFFPILQKQNIKFCNIMQKNMSKRREKQTWHSGLWHPVNKNLTSSTGPQTAQPPGTSTLSHKQIMVFISPFSLLLAGILLYQTFLFLNCV